MCEIALIGAPGNVGELRRVLLARHEDDELEVHETPDPLAVRAFPEGDAVVALTLGGCSCPLLEGLGLAQGPGREAHLAGPGYAFRRALASAALRFGEIRLLIHRPRAAPLEPRVRTTTLNQLLRTGLLPDDAFVFIKV